MTINNLFTSGCFVFFVYRSAQCSQRFWLFKNKTKQCQSTIYPQYINRLLKNKTQQFYIFVSSPLLMPTQRKRGNAATVILLLLQFDLFNNYLFIQFVQQKETEQSRIGNRIEQQNRKQKKERGKYSHHNPLLEQFDRKILSSTIYSSWSIAFDALQCIVMHCM